MLQCERRSPSRRLRPDNGDGGVHGSSFVSLAFLRSCFPVLSFPAPVSDAVGRDGLDNDFEYDALVLIRTVRLLSVSAAGHCMRWEAEPARAARS